MLVRSLSLALLFLVPGLARAQPPRPSPAVGLGSSVGPTAPPTTVGPGSAPLVPRLRMVQFRVDDDDAQLEQQDEMSPRGWRVLCHGNCDKLVLPGVAYRVKGAGVHKSRPFGVVAGEGRLLLDVEVGRVAPWVTGIVLTPVGGVLLLSGLVVTAMASSCADCAHPQTDDRRSMRDVGLGVAIVGVGTIAAGILLITRNRTIVNIEGVGADEAALPLGAGVALTPRGFVF